MIFSSILELVYSCCKTQKPWTVLVLIPSNDLFFIIWTCLFMLWNWSHELCWLWFHQMIFSSILDLVYSCCKTEAMNCVGFDSIKWSFLQYLNLFIHVVKLRSHELCWFWFHQMIFSSLFELVYSCCETEAMNCVGFDSIKWSFLQYLILFIHVVKLKPWTVLVLIPSNDLFFNIWTCLFMLWNWLSHMNYSDSLKKKFF